MASLHPTNLRELNDLNAGAAPWRHELVQPEIGGGKARHCDLAILDDHPSAAALRISGLDQAVFEALVSDYGHRYRALYLWKCPRISDFTPLESLPQLTHIVIYWNQRATCLWNFERTPNLRGLQFEDFSRLHDLADIPRATSLQELSFGNAVWPKAVFESLEPLRSLTTLQSLWFNAKRIEDGRVEALASLTGLHELGFPVNQFTTRQVAWLRAHLPALVTGQALGPVVEEVPGWSDGNVYVVGKRKPTLHATRNARRIEHYVAEFNAQVRAFKENPMLQPD